MHFISLAVIWIALLCIWVWRSLCLWVWQSLCLWVWRSGVWLADTFLFLYSNKVVFSQFCIFLRSILSHDNFHPPLIRFHEIDIFCVSMITMWKTLCCIHFLSLVFSVGIIFNFVASICMMISDSSFVLFRVRLCPLCTAFVMERCVS